MGINKIMKLKRKKLDCSNNKNLNKRINKTDFIKKQKFKEKSKYQKCFLLNIKEKLSIKSFLIKHVNSFLTSTKDNDVLQKSTMNVSDDISFSSNKNKFISYQMDYIYVELINEETYNVEYMFNHIEDKKTLLHQIQLYENMVIYLMHIHFSYPTISIKTVLLAISLVKDVFRSRIISSNDATIVGVTCCFIASKFEDVLALTLNNCMRFSNEEFSKQDVCEVELQILTIIGFRITRSHSIEIARTLLNIQHTKNSIKQICDIICICCTLSSTISSEKPSSIASCAILMSHKIENEEPDPELLKWLSYISKNEDRALISIISEHMKTTVANLYQKYYCFRNLINQVANNEIFEFIIKSINC
ncbi:Cyclin, N-terminal domain and Cyclin-like domain-containing protein [Strongyloides ratti]|uniref:Cyclin, N-terminal domain and Cyclin-like domain-containing protein n=1 Tax=Strongyloides ratti TaxID=34506 RepID=A0A090MWK8_STRRB|nr:Cyclin, N-terminal domain and Cyclin-like domain-containing protein [Strongyloides ratti]CEF63859.1 Cyclin, N-terminal domain and Cyclin-like domain-containing protein [Strongyloides ratti]